MTTDHSQGALSERAVSQPEFSQGKERAARSQFEEQDDRQKGVGHLVAAGAMTALLSGDVRLAVRATRLLMDEDGSAGRASSSTPPRRTWRRSRMRMRGSD
jgi:hypothetical protein